VHDAGHYLALEQPERFAQLIADLEQPVLQKAHA
jgi:hypothetical protein